ncbi:uncharacterized protein BJ212DRAFT_702138 [Suillus subaureus]|uniref:Uncharacterized protein n=1 Tax=Suillus subaureus TaxID=48587 RepID=A0A9P7JHQ4_9AGAM|nr:uncharacterized protein BJ212DRAFT_702138 [Suillus subaureus]KAG1823766.1 hypothetical protein BJ212DRAFT_702138 [Suillus subaureus]
MQPQACLHRPCRSIVQTMTLIGVFEPNLNFGKYRWTIGICLAGALVCALLLPTALMLTAFLDNAILSVHTHAPYEDPQISPPVHVQFIDWVLGICSFFGIINLIDKGRIRGDDHGDSSAAWRVRLFLFIGFAFMAGGLAGSVSLLVLKYVMMDYPNSTHTTAMPTYRRTWP